MHVLFKSILCFNNFYSMEHIMYFEKLNYIMKHTHTHIIKRFKLHNYNFFYINGEDVIIKRTFQKYTMICTQPKNSF